MIHYLEGAPILISKSVSFVGFQYARSNPQFLKLFNSVHNSKPSNETMINCHLSGTENFEKNMHFLNFLVHPASRPTAQDNFDTDNSTHGRQLPLSAVFLPAAEPPSDVAHPTLHRL